MCIEYCAPITSFAWSEVNAATLCACSVDTTCTVWDVNVSNSPAE